MKNEMKNPIRFLFFLAALEGLLACFLTFNIPGEGNSSLLGGLSLQRFALIAGSAVLSIVLFLLGLKTSISDKVRENLIGILNTYSSLFGWFTLIFLFFLLFPPVIISTSFHAQFLRLFYVAIWICFTSLQFVFFLTFSNIKQIGRANTKTKYLEKIRRVFPWAACAIIPILFMTPRLWVFGDHNYSVGNDFVPFSYYYKVYLLDFLANFQLPLWSPSEAAGFPFFASPHTQTFYPLNIPLALFYWWKGSYGLIDHTWFTVLAISIFCCGMYAWLKQFPWKSSSALLAAITISVSFAVTELIRFPFALHNIAWLPWLLFFITRTLASPAEHHSKKFYFWFCFTVFSFVTAGYLYFVYYSFFLLVPYVLLLCFNRSRIALHFAPWKFSIRNVYKPFLCILFPLILLSPYILNLMMTLFQVTSRGVRDFNFSTDHIFIWKDILGSLFFPPIASPEGWFYIGFIPLGLIVNYLISWHASDKAENLWFQNIFIKIGTVLFIAFFLSLAVGKESPLFIFLWKYFPFFYSLHNWGRICIMLVPILGFMLAAGIEVFGIQMINLSLNPDRKNLLKEFVKWGAIFLLFWLLQTYAATFPISERWNISFNLLDDRIEFFNLSLVVSSICILLAILIIGWNKKWLYLEKTITSIVLFIVLLDLFPVGAYQWVIDIIPETNPPGELNIKNYTIPSSFQYPRTFSKTNISITPAFSVGPYPTWYFNRYTEFFYQFINEVDNRDIFLGRDKFARKVYLTTGIDQTAISDFLGDAEAFPGTVEIVKYDGEILDVQVESSQDGYLSFIDNWDPFWQVSVNGKPEKLEILFGTFKSVKIHPGVSNVRFEYKPALFPISQLQKAMSEK